MSKKITHEQARETMVTLEINDIYIGERIEEFKAMASYINQQEQLEEYLRISYDRDIKAYSEIRKLNKLLELYKEFFDKLNIQLRNTFDIDYIYPHEFIIGYDIKSEDKELVKLFKQIKELENEK